MLSFSALNMLSIGNLNRQKDIRMRPVLAGKTWPWAHCYELGVLFTVLKGCVESERESK